MERHTVRAGAMIALTLMLMAAETPNLTWLEGEWCTHIEQGQQTCEIWGPARGDTMLGASQTVRDGKTRDFEFMRIELAEGGAVFHASPRGAAAVPFQQSSREATGNTFFNPRTDYPQRIRYWREGKALLAEISLGDGSKPVRFVYRRVR